MSLIGDIHAGHRERMVEGFLKNTGGLNDHQVLEILLFFAIPRIDTNPLAHKLIKMFEHDYLVDGIIKYIFCCRSL